MDIASEDRRQRMKHLSRQDTMTGQSKQFRADTFRMMRICEPWPEK